MNILVTGVSGYIGSRLVPRLVREGHEVRGLSRSGTGRDASVPILPGDAVSGAGLDDALADVDVAYFLIHSMERASDGAFVALEQTAATNFARAAARAGVPRIVYLGGPEPARGRASPHLASRLAVERILLESVPDSVALRASIVIGAQSRSFRFLVHLIERMPVMAVPAWHVHRSAPIDERDVLALLTRAATSEAAAGQTLDARGRDIVTYGGLIDRVREWMLVSRPTISLRHLKVTPIASRIAALIAGEDHALIGTLMDSLDEDLLPRDDRAADLLAVKLHSLDAAIEHALREWEETDVLAAR